MASLRVEYANQFSEPVSHDGQWRAMNAKYLISGRCSKWAALHICGSDNEKRRAQTEIDGGYVEYVVVVNIIYTLL